MIDTVSEKFKLFLTNAQVLFDRFSIKPLLYGSLGLEVLLQQDLRADDIDILIPGAFLQEDQEGFKAFLESEGYLLVDLHEHTFLKDGVKYSYASIEELKVFAGIDSFIENGSYLSLTLHDYLKVYEASLTDSYRQNKKNKNDIEKINIIKKFVEDP